jgi:hypothetical protein
MHLLCTRLPRSKEDAETLYGDQPQQQHQNPHQQHSIHIGLPQYVTVVEVLLDETGVWERGRRRNREQRWAAVDVVDGRMTDAFRDQRAQTKEHVELRLAAGFGGPRV